MNSATEIEMKTATQSDDQLAAKLTAEYGQAVGKSVNNVLMLADILIRAKSGLSQDEHKTWLLKNRTDEGKASKYRSIGECPQFKEAAVQAQLPPSFTMMYQLSRILRHSDFTPEVANGHFTATLAMLNTPKADGRFPSVEEVTSHLNGLFGKRTVATPNAESIAKSSDESLLPSQTTELPDAVPQASSNEARPVIDETTSEDVEDENDIQIRLEFAEAYRKALVRKAIARVLKENGITNVEVILRAKYAPAALAA
jgi:hypothetical protein